MDQPTPQPIPLVLDTSVFTNPDTTAQWGGGPQEAFAGLLPLADRLRQRVALYMPLAVYQELKTYLSGEVPAAFEHLKSQAHFGKIAVRVA